MKKTNKLDWYIIIYHYLKQFTLSHYYNYEYLLLRFSEFNRSSDTI